MSRPQIRFKDIKDTTKLFRDFIYKDGSLSPWLRGDFRKIQSYEKTKQELLETDFQCGRLTDILLDQNREFGASDAVEANIRKMRDEDALCSVTGHQVGLLGGPMMIFFKTLTAIKSAEKLTAELRHPVVPVFWMATDDHDLEEVDHVHLPSDDGLLKKIRYEPIDAIADKPMSHVTLDESIKDFLRSVEDELARSEFKDDLISSLSSCHAPGEPIFSAFARCFQRWFRDYGVILVNPADPRLREMAKGVFLREVDSVGEIRSAVDSSNKSLAEAQYHLQVTRGARYSNLFKYTGVRSRVGFDDGQFIVEGEDDRMSTAELLSEVQSSPELFSPNVLLRPVVQSKLFPAVEFTGGPAEIAYFAQISELFDIFKVVRPVVRPRISATIIEPKYRRFIEKHDIDLCRLTTNDDREMYLTEIMKGRFPEDLSESLEKTQDKVSKALTDIRGLIESNENLVRTLDKTARKVDYELNEFRGKVFQAFKKEQDEFSGKFRMCAEQLFPEQSLQERHYSFIYFANKYGPGIVNTLYDELDIDTSEHQTVYF